MWGGGGWNGWWRIKGDWVERVRRGKFGVEMCARALMESDVVLDRIGGGYIKSKGERFEIGSWKCCVRTKNNRGGVEE